VQVPQLKAGLDPNDPNVIDPETGMPVDPESMTEMVTQSFEPYENYWQARFAMELIADAMDKSEPRFRSYKVFKKLDQDGDGFISLKDLEDAARTMKLNVN
jgi:hypothetical protein